MTPRFQLLHVQPALPERLTPLRDLAFNVRWVWHPETAELFVRLDRNLWETTGHNPVRLLGSIAQDRLEWAANDPVFLAHMDRAHENLTELLARSAWFQRYHRDLHDFTIAYFSAEFGIAGCLPFYSGGLGVLAGDHLKSASELGLPMVGVGLAYKVGYLNQYLNADGWQQEAYRENDFYNMPLELMRDAEGHRLKVSLPFPGREVLLQIWRAQVGRVPLYLLDSNLAENSLEDQRITHQLYGGDRETRIQHEIVLGIGGVRALRLLGIQPDVCHINEGHAAFLAIERIRQIMTGRDLKFETARRVVSASSIFTTHTPVPAGFDIFDPSLMRKYFTVFAEELGIGFDDLMRLGQEKADDSTQPFNMALFAMRNASYRNAVSRLHGKVSRHMWESEWQGYPESEVPVEHITNGIHTRTWISVEMRRLLNRYLGPGWSDNPADTAEWQRLDQIPDEELWRTHMASKERLVNFAREHVATQIRNRGGPTMAEEEARRIFSPNRLTIGFARRFAAYKRATLLLRDRARLKRIITNPERPVQFIFAGKAHPADSAGKELIKQLAHFARDPEVRGSVAFLENYDMSVARYMVQGVDVWLNTPRRPLEASGTSGMKGAANGILNLSVMDGWWAEGFTSDVGWSIGHGEQYEDPEYQDEVEANALYEILEREVVPLYYQRDEAGLPAGWTGKMKASMKTLAPVFNTNRMVGEYAERFYIPAARRSRTFLNGDLGRVRDLVTWDRFIHENWKEVKVEEVEQGGGNHLHVGVRVPVRVKVRLGPIKPDQVSVELYHGIAGVDRQVNEGSATPLEPKKQEDGAWWYEGLLPCRQSGLYGYAVRVRPAHPDALVPNEITLITWF